MYTQCWWLWEKTQSKPSTVSVLGGQSIIPSKMSLFGFSHFICFMNSISILYSNYSKMQNTRKKSQTLPCFVQTTAFGAIPYDHDHNWSMEHPITLYIPSWKWSAACITLWKLFVNTFWGKWCFWTMSLWNDRKTLWRQLKSMRNDIIISPRKCTKLRLEEQRAQGLHHSFPLLSSSFLSKQGSQEILQQCLEFFILLWTCVNFFKREWAREWPKKWNPHILIHLHDNQ